MVCCSFFFFFFFSSRRRHTRWPRDWSSDVCSSDLWDDELRRAPPLELKNVSLQITNSGGHHRFGLRAVPPVKLAGPLDVRGDLTGNTVRALAEWNGRLYVALDYADIAAWRTWVPFPIELPRGNGGLRAWLAFSQHQLSEATADVRLADVRT